MADVAEVPKLAIESDQLCRRQQLVVVRVLDQAELLHPSDRVLNLLRSEAGVQIPDGLGAIESAQHRPFAIVGFRYTYVLGVMAHQDQIAIWDLDGLNRPF
jgi:hypothetical protein